jgi:hypothetical protein
LIKFLTSATCLLISTAPLAAEVSSIPIVIGGNDEMDACPSVGAVTGLKVKGDGFLSVRSGPGTQFPEKDRLLEGALFYMCGGKNARGSDWIGIVYSKKNTDTCGVTSPIENVTVYKGPCKWGWINSKWVKVVAG